MTAIQRVRVPASICYAILYLYWAMPTLVWLGPGLVLVLLGLVLRLWAAGHLKKFQGLTVSGPYRRTRNPLYLGSFLIGLGFTVAGAQPWLIGPFLLIFFALYLPVIRMEEREMEGLGDSYKAYRAAVPRFFPLPGSRRVLPPELTLAEGREFQWGRVISNREYRAVVWALIIAAAVLIKIQLGQAPSPGKPYEPSGLKTLRGLEIDPAMSPIAKGFVF